MVNVSKASLNKKLKIDLYEQLLDVLISLDAKKASRKAFSDLLTDAELIQLSKRLSVIVMLSQGVTEYRIQRLLHLSPTTVHTHAQKLDTGEYDSILRALNTKKHRNHIVKMLDVLLRMGLPSYTSKNRWKWIEEMEQQLRE